MRISAHRKERFGDSALNPAEHFANTRL